MVKNDLKSWRISKNHTLDQDAWRKTKKGEKTNLWKTRIFGNTWLLDVVVCNCNRATLLAEFWEDVGSVLLAGNSPSIGG